MAMSEATTMWDPTPDPDEDAPLDPLPPADIAAEQALLGAVLLSAAAFDQVAGIVQVDDFYRPAHGEIWRSVCTVRAQAQEIDLVLVSKDLLDRGQLTKCGGAVYLHTLIRDVATTTNVLHYSDIVIEKSRLRDLREMGMQVQHLAEAGGRHSDSAEIIDLARRTVEQATSTRGVSNLVSVHNAAWSFIDGLDEPVHGGVATPWIDLNKVLNGGLRPGELIIVAARPGVGKTIAGVDMARSAAQQDIPAVMFSLEMSTPEIMARVISDMGAVPLTGLISHTLNGEERDRAKKAADRISDAPLWVDDSSELTVPEIEARATRLPRKPGLIVVDYLGLVTPLDKRAPRQEQVAAMSAGFKRMAKKLGCPVVVLHQLNRGPETRQSKRPTKSDLRESGAIEQDADKVVLLWRHEQRDGEICFIVDKHRNGPTGDVWLEFEGRYARISNGAW